MSYIYENELDKGCFQLDMAYGGFKDLARRTASDKGLRNKAFNIAKDPKYDGYQRGLVSMVYKCFDKKSASLPDKSVSSSGINIEVKPSEQLVEELHKLIIGKCEKITVYSRFKDNILGANLADIQLISRFNKGFRFLLCAIDIFTKHALVFLLMCLGFYNNSFKKWLKDNDIEMYSAHNEGKSVVAERFIRTLKNKIYKYMTLILKNMYIDKLDDIVNEYNNTYYRKIKMKPVDVKDNTYIDFIKEVNEKSLKFKVDDHLRISKYKNIFAKGYTPNWLEEVFVIKNVENTVPWTYVISNLNGDEIIGAFHNKEMQ